MTKNKSKIRLNIYRSNANIFAQLIDDTQSITLASASSLKMENGGNIKAAAAVGEEIANKALELKLTDIVYDRNGFQYKGRVKALAEAARAKGLKF